jgi:hypothetical protein
MGLGGVGIKEILEVFDIPQIVSPWRMNSSFGFDQVLLGGNQDPTPFHIKPIGLRCKIIERDRVAQKNTKAKAPEGAVRV